MQLPTRSSRGKASASRSRRTRRALVPLLLLAAVGPAAAAFDCKKIEADGFTFDLGALSGDHAIITSVYHPPRFTNVTYTLDLCGPLKRKDDVKKEDACPDGTWVCGISHIFDTDKKSDSIGDIRPIAAGGDALEPKATRLSTSKAEADKDKVGLRIALDGGKWENRAQKAVVELLCDEKLEGNEGEWDPKELKSPAAAAMAVGTLEDKKEDDGVPRQLKKDGAALVWDGFGPASDDANVEVLRLTWKTKHACEKREESGGGGGGDGSESQSWGFFTWMVILVFLGAAAYLIFGSWLNYSRYGARGWDLLPHGDTIRDVPYLMQDWVRRLIQVLQGGGSRGGYSAV